MLSMEVRQTVPRCIHKHSSISTADHRQSHSSNSGSLGVVRGWAGLQLGPGPPFISQMLTLLPFLFTMISTPLMQTLPGLALGCAVHPTTAWPWLGIAKALCFSRDSYYQCKISPSFSWHNGSLWSRWKCGCFHNCTLTCAEQACSNAISVLHGQTLSDLFYLEEVTSQINNFNCTLAYFKSKLFGRYSPFLLLLIHPVYSTINKHSLSWKSSLPNDNLSALALCEVLFWVSSSSCPPESSYAATFCESPLPAQDLHAWCLLLVHCWPVPSSHHAPATCLCPPWSPVAKPWAWPCVKDHV